MASMVSIFIDNNKLYLSKKNYITYHNTPFFDFFKSKSAHRKLELIAHRVIKNKNNNKSFIY